MQYINVPVTHYQQNCSIIWCEDTMKAAIVDPGGDIDQILIICDERNLKIEKILLTHGHMDHCGGTAELVAKRELPVIGPHQDDIFWISALEQQAQMMGFKAVEGFTPNQWLNDGDSVSVGNVELNVLHCPGHTPGHVVFFHQASQKAFVGDVLFKGSIGRTDFPKGNYEQLVRSIRGKLWPLGDAVTFVPGHGPESSFGEERRSNAFVADTRFG
ncbi:MAG: hydroxyacylglutathione hydrolase [Flavobacteriales bacterium]|jgi:hydroxyacylglutathione hydrolase